MRKIVTRSNGLPAYVGAAPRLRQSHINRQRKLIRELVEANRIVQEENGVSEPGPLVAGVFFLMIMAVASAVAYASGGFSWTWH